FDTFVKLVGALISRTSYPAAPVSPSFWNSHVNDFSFEKPTPGRTVRERHQARLWKTDIRTSDGRAVYVGVAVLESGLKWHIVYRIRPDVDAEREGLLRDLLAAGLIASDGRNRFVPPMTGRNSFGDPYFTDGKITTIHLE
ncbi:MAG: LssY C-terminal domain-containing protein, partial [Candidatus Deferrimicrobiaceae bacterium]